MRKFLPGWILISALGLLLKVFDFEVKSRYLFWVGELRVFLNGFLYILLNLVCL